MLTIFPNYGAKLTYGKVWLEASHPLLLAALCSAKISLAVAAHVHRDSSEGNYLPLKEPAVSFVSLGIVNSNAARLNRIGSYFRQLKPILATVRQSEFCYIFTPGNVGLIAVLTCWLLRKPYALYLRGDWTVGTLAVFHFLGERILAKAQFILCTGNALCEAVKRFNPNAEAVVPMSPVLFGEDKFHDSENSEELTTVLFVGQMLRDKGIFELLTAFERLTQELSEDLNLIYAGDGRDKPLLMQLITEKGLQRKIRCIGLITDPVALAEIYRSSNIFCLPTYFPEGFPRVLYEAMRFSLPILTTPVGQITTVFRDGQNGLLCEPRAVDSLKMQLQRLVADPVLRQTLGKAARASLEPLLDQWQGETHGHQVLKWLEQTGFDRIVALPFDSQRHVPDSNYCNN